MHYVLYKYKILCLKHYFKLKVKKNLHADIKRFTTAGLDNHIFDSFCTSQRRKMNNYISRKCNLKFDKDIVASMGATICDHKFIIFSNSKKLFYLLF